jgi:hypothetical protein
MKKAKLENKMVSVPENKADVSFFEGTKAEVFELPPAVNPVRITMAKTQKATDVVNGIKITRLYHAGRDYEVSEKVAEELKPFLKAVDGAN